MKLNTYDVPANLDTLTRQQISMLLGNNTLPKYNASQLKSTTKEKLLEELKALIEFENDYAQNTAVKKRGRKATGCTTLASAKVKKSKLINDVVLGKTSYTEAIQIITFDKLLQSILSADMVYDIYCGKNLPKRGRPKKVGN